MLKVSSLKAPHQERKAKVAQRERRPSHRNTLKNVLEVNVPTSNRHNGALVEVGAKAGDNPKTVENKRQILEVLLDRRHKNGGVIREERGAQDGASPPQLMKQTKMRSPFQDLSKRVNGDHKKERR
jgi:hypothetical protein